MYSIFSSTHQFLLQVKVWTEESYAQKYEIPEGFSRVDEKERACDRDIMKVVAYCYHAEVNNGLDYNSNVDFN